MDAKIIGKSLFPTNQQKKYHFKGSFSVSEKEKKPPLLDINVNKSATPVNTGVSGGLINLYHLRDEAGKIMPTMGVNKCGKVPYKSYISIDRNECGIKRYGNVSHCNSVWFCPICAFKKMMIRREQVKDIFKVHNDSGCSFHFVTLTIKHRSDDPLTVLINKLQIAWKQITKERRLKPLFKIANYIQTLEIRYNENTGWHPHYHAVFMSTEKIQPLFDDLIDSWTKKTGASLACQNCKAASDQESLSEYILKMSLANELVYGQVKESKKADSLSYFEMLRNTQKYKKQIEEYASATKGVRSLRKSKGLNIINDQDEPKDEVIETLLNIHKVVYNDMIVKKCNYKMVLDNVEKWDWIKAYFIDYHIFEDIKLISPFAEADPLKGLRERKGPYQYEKL